MTNLFTTESPLSKLLILSLYQFDFSSPSNFGEGSWVPYSLSSCVTKHAGSLPFFSLFSDGRNNASVLQECDEAQFTPAVTHAQVFIGPLPSPPSLDFGDLALPRARSPWAVSALQIPAAQRGPQPAARPHRERCASGSVRAGSSLTRLGRSLALSPSLHFGRAPRWPAGAPRSENRVVWSLLPLPLVFTCRECFCSELASLFQPLVLTLPCVGCFFD